MSAGVDAPAGPRGPSGLAVALLLTVGASAVFYYRQNFAAQVGGPISIEKSLWLNYTLTAWFVVPAFLVRHPALAPSVGRILAWFLASMVTRGVAELWLIYVAFGWSPLYGIGHDLFNIGLIALLKRRAAAAGGRLDAFDIAVRRFCTSIQASVVAEVVFAVLFYRMNVHGDAVYFAPPTEAFAHINLLTRYVDVILYADLISFLWRQRAALSARMAPLPGVSSR